MKRIEKENYLSMYIQKFKDLDVYSKQFFDPFLHYTWSFIYNIFIKEI